MHDWVGDLSLGAKWMTKMKAENTIHCLGPEMPALFHVELLPYRYNPFPAAHGFQLSSLPWRSGRCLKNSCQGVPDEVSFAPGQGRSSGVTAVQCHRTSSLVQRCKSTQSWALSSLAVEKFFQHGPNYHPHSLHKDWAWSPPANSTCGCFWKEQDVAQVTGDILGCPW